MNTLLSPIKVLFVDDEPALRDLGADLLTEEGYEVVCANNAREALELFTQHQQPFDVVVTDESMPGMTGAELAQKLFEIAPHMPVILCSGYHLSMADEGINATNIRAVLAKTDVFSSLPATIAGLFSRDQR